MRQLPGLIKAHAEDFRVYEIPSFEPEGIGDHLYLWIEKRGVSTPRLLSALAQRCALKVRDLGCAGRKDQIAVSQQWVSLPRTLGGRLDELPENHSPVELDDGYWRILDRQLHPRRLKVGNLLGNRFDILVRGLSGDECKELIGRCEQLVDEGYLVNAYGEQRFIDPHALEQAKRLFRRRRLRGRRDTFVLSIAQAAIFNRYLFYRREFREPISGEWYVTGNGGRFDGEREDLEQLRERLGRGEITPLGPMLGRDVNPTGQCEELVRKACADLDLEALDWSCFGKRLRGAWRATVVPLKGLQSEHHGDAVRLGFSLPAGSYATVVLRRLLEGQWMFPFNH